MPKITTKRIRAGAAHMRHSVARAVVLLALSFAAASNGQESSLVGPTSELSESRLTIDESTPALAFGRYLASLQERNVFTESGPIGMEIEASLPGLGKEGRMLLVR
jgi:hypothetical protein